MPLIKFMLVLQLCAIDNKIRMNGIIFLLRSAKAEKIYLHKLLFKFVIRKMHYTYVWILVQKYKQTHQCRSRKYLLLTLLGENNPYPTRQRHRKILSEQEIQSIHPLTSANWQVPTTHLNRELMSRIYKKLKKNLRVKKIHDPVKNMLHIQTKSSQNKK